MLYVCKTKTILIESFMHFLHLVSTHWLLSTTEKDVSEVKGDNIEKVFNW